MLTSAALALVLAGSPSSVEEAKSAYRALEKKYAIDIQWEYEFKEIQPNWNAATRKPTEEDLVEFAPILTAAMAVYPEKLWKSGKITTIVLAKQCLKNGVSWGGMAVRSRKALLLDISAARKDDWVKGTFHHEVFHLVDPISETDWSKLNPEKFAYRPVSQPGAVDKTNTQAGFLNAYSRTAAGEDRAELFSAMVAEPDAVKKQVKADDLLRGKVAKLKSATATYGLDATWWKARGF